MHEPLVTRARDGDQAAFAALVEPQLPYLRRVAVGILLDPDAAADVLQEALIAAWRELPRLRDPRAFEGWLRRIVVNRSRNALRARKQQAPLDVLNQVPWTIDGEDRAIAVADLADAFRVLPVEDRVLLALYYADDRSIDSIASELGAPVGTIKSRLHAARQRLRRRLEGPL